MPALTHAPARVADPVAVPAYLPEHPQYTPISNDEELARVADTQAGNSIEGDGSFLRTWCMNGADTCSADEAFTLSVNPLEGKAGFTVPGGAGAEIDLDRSDEGGTSKTGAEGAVSATGKLGDTELGVKGGGKGAYERTGSIVPLDDGRFRVQGGHAIEVAGKGSISTGTGEGGVSVGFRQGSGGTRIFSAAEVETARKQASGDDIVAAQILLAKPESALDLEEGESLTREIGLEGEVEGEIGMPAGVQGGLQHGQSVVSSMTRTSAGLVISATETLSHGGKLGVTLGAADVLAGAETTGSNKLTSTTTYTLTVDPVTQADLVKRLEGLSGLQLCEALRAAGAKVRQGGGSAEETSQTKVNVGPLSHDDTSTGAVTWDGLGGFDASFSDVLATPVPWMSALEEHTAGYHDGGLDLDAFGGMDAASRTQSIGRDLDAGDLEELARLANGADAQRATPVDAVADMLAWQELQQALVAVQAGPEEGRADRVAIEIGRYVAQGGDPAAIDTLCRAQGLGMLEQWPASVVRGQERYDALVAEVAGSPTPATLDALDVLRGQVAGAGDFTVPEAKAATLERLEALRTDAVEKLAVGNPEAGELLEDDMHAKLAMRVARCSAYRSEEERMYEGVGGAKNIPVYERLAQFYAGWDRAVEDVRAACAELGLPEVAWRVSVDGQDRQPVYEPTIDRALALHTAKGGLRADFATHLAWRLQ
ncbi:MAG: hypothetical protein KC656_12165 [Myxococcales bacterium]|nr:hypothetical protein [Myxococcales bacterium]